MNWKIKDEDTKIIFILKMMYLIPLIFISYLPCALIEGCKEIGNPFEDIIESFLRRK